MVFFSKHLIEEVLGVQPLAPVLALLQGVLHRCRIVFKVIKAQKNLGSLDSSSHRTETSIGHYIAQADGFSADIQLFWDTWLSPLRWEKGIYDNETVKLDKALHPTSQNESQEYGFNLGKCKWMWTAQATHPSLVALILCQPLGVSRGFLSSLLHIYSINSQSNLQRSFGPAGSQAAALEGRVRVVAPELSPQLSPKLAPSPSTHFLSLLRTDDTSCFVPSNLSLYPL